MALALIVEDGSLVAKANSFADLDTIREYNALRLDTDLPETDDDVVRRAIAAMDYMQIFEARWSGSRVLGFRQRLSWPRSGATAFGDDIPNDIVPNDIVNAQCYLVGIAGQIDLYANVDTRAIIEDTLGPLTTKYAPNVGAIGGPLLPTLLALVEPYFTVGGGMLRSVRV